MEQWKIIDTLETYQCPGMEIHVAVSKNIKKGYSVVTLFYKINNDISIVNKNYEKYTNKQKHHDYQDTREKNISSFNQW